MQALRFSRSLSALAVASAVVWAGGARAADLLVLPDGGGPYPTIQSAVDAADTGDSVVLGTGTFVGAGNRDILVDGKQITLRSESGDPASSVIDCEGTAMEPHRGLCIRGGEFMARGISIRNGDVSGAEPGRSNGGGILIEDVERVTLEVCIVESCTAFDGGGVYVRGLDRSVVILTDCEFRQNVATGIGGGVACVFGSLEISNSLVLGNEGGDGGGVVISSADGSIDSSVFVRNRSHNYGGAVIVDTGRLSIERSTLVENRADNEYGAAVFSGALSEIGSESQLRMQSSLVAFNGDGVAIGCDGQSSAQLTCCILYGNGSDELDGCVGGVEEGTIHEDPLPCTSEDEDWSVHANSPCLPDNNGCGVQIGASGAGCPASPVLRSSWGGIKSLFRD
ncbi:MAG: right-handed parallel beta-helix repeat-containing protein [Candidatus Eisenbacteria bacterium]